MPATPSTARTTELASAASRNEAVSEKRLMPHCTDRATNTSVTSP